MQVLFVANAENEKRWAYRLSTHCLCTSVGLIKLQHSSSVHMQLGTTFYIASVYGDEQHILTQMSQHELWSLMSC